MRDPNVTPQSFSSLDSYSKCPYCYYLKRVLRQKVLYADFTGTVPGLICHNVVEKLFKDKNSSPDGSFNKEPMDALYEENFNTYINASSTHLTKLSFAPDTQTAKPLIYSWLLNLVEMLEINNLILPVTISEFRFGGYHNPLVISPTFHFMGGPDLWASKSRDLPGRLIDFKASETLFHSNVKQLILYVIALEIAEGLKTSMAGFFLFKSRQPKWYAPDEDKKKATLDWAENIIQKIGEKKFDPSPSQKACHLCAFRFQCEHSSHKVEKSSSIMAIGELKSFDLSNEEEIPSL